MFSEFEEDGPKDHDVSKERPKKEPMKVVLRVKPFTQKDKNSKEDQGISTSYVESSFLAELDYA